MAKAFQNYRQEIKQICQDQKITYLALFGSYARHDAKKESDIDLLVEYDPKIDIGINHILRTEEKFSQLFKKKVDLVPKDSLDKYIAPYIQDDLEILYA